MLKTTKLRERNAKREYLVPSTYPCEEDVVAVAVVAVVVVIVVFILLVGFVALFVCSLLAARRSEEECK
jgi:hypothetical protein